MTVSRPCPTAAEPTYTETEPSALQFQARRLLRPGAAALDKAGDRDAVIAAVDQPALQARFSVPAELGKAALERLAIVAAVAFGIDRRAAGLQPSERIRHLATAIRLRRRISTLSIPRSPAASSISRSQKNDAS